MNKKILFLIFWLINILSLLFIILIPKDSNAYQILYLMTMEMIFVIPLILTFAQGYLTLYKDRKRDIYDVIPNGGSVLMMLLVFVKFVKSIEKQAIPQMITILGVFIGAELLLGYLKVEYKDISKKKATWLEIATFASLVIFFFCTMLSSVDFGKI